MSRLTFWHRWSPLQRRAIVLVGASLLIGFFLSRRETTTLATFSRAPWQEYVSRAPAFRVRMPEIPRHMVQDVSLKSLGITIRKGVFVSEDSDGREYVLAVSQYPKHIPPFVSEQIVEAELQTLFSNTSDFAIDKSLNVTGADFSAHRFDGGSSVQGRVLIDGASVYVFSVSAQPSAVFDDLYQQFITSFHTPKI